MAEKNILAVIPARGGSKRVKDKNIKKINGKPLIAYTIEEALLSESLNKVVVSTDSEKIAAVSKKFGVDVPFMRPESLAQDESSSADATRHAVEEVESLEGKKADCVVLLQPTSPFRKAWHINKAVEKFLEEKANSLFSVSKPSKESRFLVYLENGKMQFAGSGKQKGKELFNLNGAIFIHDRKTLFSGGKYPIGKKCVLFEMPERNSVDIDTEEDFLKAEKLAKRLEKK